jgi:hypothetical protein
MQVSQLMHRPRPQRAAPKAKRPIDHYASDDRDNQRE